jgi:hypothetical protein
MFHPPIHPKRFPYPPSNTRTDALSYHYRRQKSSGDANNPDRTIGGGPTIRVKIVFVDSRHAKLIAFQYGARKIGSTVLLIHRPLLRRIRRA